ncbi:MAG: hypothetical protein EZS28_004913 [Streblomastix strix]|uniref:Uncharacterized protein n=1 Tax=Streblomastix strix TaxID=222440 RepID=A0A5J4WZD1_9EUKA|nr:MAG: hypothetical protein EZS28_004913 [Streblomastix strix]
MSNVYIDERLLDAAGLSDFPELYADIKERYPKPFEQQPQPVSIWDQTLQQQVKNNDDIIYASNEVFEPPVPNTITKLDLSSQLERQNFLAFKCSDPLLIVYGDRITLTALYATTGTYILDNYINESASNEASTEEPDSFIDEVIIKHEKQLGSSPQPQYAITNIFNKFVINDFFRSSAYNTFYIVDDGTCRVCVFNRYFESKGLNGKTQEVGRIPDSILSADGKKLQESILMDSADVYKYCASEMHLLKNQIVSLKGREGIQWANDNVYKPFIKPLAKPILGALGRVGQTIGKGLKSGSNLIREYTIYHRGKAIDGSLQNDATTESFIYNRIKPKTFGTYTSMREIEELIGNQTAIPYTIPIRFRVSIPFDDLLKLSAFTDYPNVNPIISMAKCQTVNKDELLGSSQQKLMDVDLMFRNWSLTFQYTKQFILLRCTADLITGLHAEPLTESGLKNLVYDIKPVTISIKNYVITEATANMVHYKATDACLN